MGIIVANKYRLGMDGDKFSQKFKTHLRSLKIDEDDMKAYNKQYQTTGILYELDKEATDKRNAILAPKTKKTKQVKTDE